MKKSWKKIITLFIGCMFIMGFSASFAQEPPQPLSPQYENQTPPPPAHHKTKKNHKTHKNHQRHQIPAPLPDNA